MSLKRIISTVIGITMLLSVATFNGVAAQDVKQINDVRELKLFDDVREKDLSRLDFTGKSDLLFTLTFDTNTKWPGKSKMPADFDPVKLMESGKDPGLGIRRLQGEGFTGNGVAIAYIDQHLLLDHQAYKNVKLHNYEIQKDKYLNPSMHGPAVLSLLAGKTQGIVPDAEVYFFGHNGMEDDNEYEARAFEKIIEINKQLPINKKIKIIGMSHSADDRLNKEYAKHLRAAEDKARKSGIIVIDTNCNMATCGVSGFKDRDSYTNYQLSNWEKSGDTSWIKGRLLVPADFRTTAVGHRGDTKQYAYWGNGGFSWGVPFITGVITMGLQINPELTEDKAFEYLSASADKFLDGCMINSKGFLEMVKKNCPNAVKVTRNKDNGSESGDEENVKDINNYQSVTDGICIFNSDYSGGFVKVNSIKTERIGDKIYFTISYKSSKARDYSYFNPPEGDKLMGRVSNGIKKGSHQTKFSVGIEQIKSIEMLTIRFGFDDKPDWIFIDSNQLKALLKSAENAKPAVPTGLSVIITGTEASLNWQPVPGAQYYKVHYKKINESDKVITTSKTKQIIQKLSKATQYEFYITAVNSAGESKYSASIIEDTD
jgi:hypothetical protein